MGWALDTSKGWYANKQRNQTNQIHYIEIWNLHRTSNWIFYLISEKKSNSVNPDDKFCYMAWMYDWNWDL